MTNKSAPVPDEYIGIAAWGEWMGSLAYYIEQEQRRAVRMNAPLDAIFWSQDPPRWCAVSDLAQDHPFHAVYKAALEARQATLRG